MALKPLPAQVTLRQYLDYNPETGDLTWLFCEQQHARFNTRWAGRPAFTSIGPSGYRFGQISRISYQAHRIIWKWWHGSDPEWIDHIDGDKLNNRISNLRSVSRVVNARNMPLPRNNTSGEIGIHKCSLTGRWRVQLTADYKVHRFGRFDTIEEAVAARDAAMAKHGFHENHGRKV